MWFWKYKNIGFNFWNTKDSEYDFWKEYPIEMSNESDIPNLTRPRPRPELFRRRPDLKFRIWVNPTRSFWAGLKREIYGRPEPHPKLDIPKPGPEPKPESYSNPLQRGGMPWRKHCSGGGRDNSGASLQGRKRRKRKRRILISKFWWDGDWGKLGIFFVKGA